MRNRTEHNEIEVKRGKGVCNFWRSSLSHVVRDGVIAVILYFIVCVVVAAVNAAVCLVTLNQKRSLKIDILCCKSQINRKTSGYIEKSK